MGSSGRTRSAGAGRRGPGAVAGGVLVVALALVGLWIRSDARGGDGREPVSATSSAAAARRTEGEELFRDAVEPLFAERCYECHGPAARRAKGGLRISGRAALLEGGHGGPALVPGDPEGSAIIEAVHRLDPDLAMPPDEAEALTAAEIDALERWIELGAPWPLSAASAGSAAAADADPASPAADANAGTRPAPAQSGAPPDEVPAAREAVAPDPLSAGETFFEREIRPLIAHRCFRCHGPRLGEVEGGLRMADRAALEAGGDRGPALVPGDPDASLLVRAVRREGALAMPPDEALPEREVELLERWVAMGAPWPRTTAGGGGIDVGAARERWAFRPVERPDVPAVPPGGPEPASPIDAFVFARLAAEGLAPSPLAGERTLVRRAYYELIGLPPTYAELERYQADDAPDKWSRLVDELLARPEYGERQARRWLDVVRFAQTNGYERDEEKPYAWRYRDWVIEAFNADLPWDEFVRRHVAGDELPDAPPDAVVATGFFHLGPWDDEPDDELTARYDAYDDALRVIGEGFLGLTVGCARCHDHEFDPIRQTDYYSLLAFVHNVRPYAKPVFAPDSDTHVPLGFGAAARERWEAERAARIADLERQVLAIHAEQRRVMVEAVVAELPPEVQELYARRFDPGLTEAQRAELARYAHLVPGPQEVKDALPFEASRRLFTLEQEIDDTRASFAGSLEWALAARERDAEPPPTFVFARGMASAPEAEVEPRFPPVLCPDDAASRPTIPPPPADASSSGRRRVLADWIASPKNPLTARVAANRVWLACFGRGIVATPNDFGAAGEPPTHPDLLDWLAAELVARGWSLKALHREILSSYVWRMSSDATDATALALDPGNRLLWRQELRRLEAEAVRDTLLAVTGELSSERGGRGFFPALSREALASTSKPGDGWELSPPEQRARRSIYVYVKRGLLVPLLDVFDLADPTLPRGRRATTTIAPQALALLNGGFASGRATVLAERVRAEAGADPSARVRALFRRALARDPSAAELAAAGRYLERQAAAFAARPPRLVIRPLVPERVQTQFLQALPDDAFLAAPERWSGIPGRWGTPYNETLETDPERGPAVLLESVRYADGVVRARLVPRRGARLVGLLLRAGRAGDVFTGLEVRLDVARGRLALLAHPADAEAAPREIASALAPLAAGEAHDLEVELDGAAVRVVLDGRCRLEVPTAAPAGPDADGGGAIGLRAAGDALLVERLTVETDAGPRELVPRALDPADRALEALCLVVLNLNELVYVD